MKPYELTQMLSSVVILLHLSTSNRSSGNSFESTGISTELLHKQYSSASFHDSLLHFSER